MGIEEKSELDLLREKLDLLYIKCLDGDAPSTLFHYTDAGGLLGILGGQQLWASHTLFLNDVTEITHTNGIVEEIFRDLIGKAEPDDEAKKDYAHPIWKYRDFLLCISTNTMRPKPNPDNYVVCFCQDGDLLSQWRGYGNRGAGYAIGFDTIRLVQPNNAFKLCKVIYSAEDQKNILSNILNVVIDSFEKLTNSLDSDSARNHTDAHASIFENEVTRYATFFKHHAFKEEKEWRLIYTPTVSDHTNQIKFRSGRLGLIPYIEISLPSNENCNQEEILPIVSVRIGPTAQPAHQRKALEMLAGDKYQNLEILESDIPLQ